MSHIRIFLVPIFAALQKQKLAHRIRQKYNRFFYSIRNPTYFLCNFDSTQFIENGEGTAQREIRNILGIEDDRKSIVFSFIKRDAIPEATKELEAFFLSSPKNKGIGYSIPINSLIGMQLYRFLADTL